MRTSKKPIIGIFLRTGKRRALFELWKPDNFPFPYFIISKAKSPYLRSVNAFSVLDSWEGKTKVLHTGLIRFDTHWYFGDNVNKHNKKDFILLHTLPKAEKILLFIFENCSPKDRIRYAERCVKDYALFLHILKKNT